MLHITADANIPFAHEAFGAFGEVQTLPGHAITPDTLSKTDVLLVRSVTEVGDVLLGGTPVRFVGTATAGTDHVRLGELADRGIAFASAPGSNAASVVDWVLAGMLSVAADRGEELVGRTLGIIGLGAVGGRLAPRAEALGLEVLACDPPRHANGAGGLVELDEILAQADIVSLHTPLTGPGESPWPTHSMIDAQAAGRMKPGAWLVNAARGRVVTADAALALARTRPVLLDVWPGEPDPSPDLIEAVALATPHIAGYAWDGKVRGTVMLADALRQWAGAGGPGWRPPLDPVPTLAAPTTDSGVAWLDALARQAYDIRADDRRFRAAMADPADRAAAFAELRRTYPRRRELSRYALTGAVPPSLHAAVSGGLGVTLNP